jgi:hypothetical protein
MCEGAEWVMGHWVLPRFSGTRLVSVDLCTTTNGDQKHTSLLKLAKIKQQEHCTSKSQQLLESSQRDAMAHDESHLLIGGRVRYKRCLLARSQLIPQDIRISRSDVAKGDNNATVWRMGCDIHATVREFHNSRYIK